MSCTLGLYIHNIICCVCTCNVHFVGRDQFRSHTMEFMYFVNLIFIFVVNVLFFFSGICVNSLVIVSFWRSVQLRKKLCYFTIMILSCCDLLVVLTNHPVVALTAMLWLTEKINVYPGWLVNLLQLSDICICFSLLALFVMNIDRYLATYYPIFHRTSVTKGKVLTFFALLVVLKIMVAAISINKLVVSYDVGLVIFDNIFISLMLFINYKLFTIARKSRRNSELSPDMKKSFSFKNISSCLLAVSCLIILFIPSLVYIVLRLTSKERKFTLDNSHLAGLWVATTVSMNSTFDCLIFYWKNKILRTEGMKIIKGMKIFRRVQS